MQDTLHLQRLGCEGAVQGSKFFSGGVYDERATVFKSFKVMTPEFGLPAIERTSSPQKHRGNLVQGKHFEKGLGCESRASSSPSTFSVPLCLCGETIDAH